MFIRLAAFYYYSSTLSKQDYSVSFYVSKREDEKNTYFVMMYV